MKYPAIIMPVIFILLGCKSPNKLHQQSRDEVASQLHVLNDSYANENKIVFLNFEITEIDSIREEYSFKLINKIYADGILKKSPFAVATSFEKNYLYCEISSAEKQRLDFVKTEDPLNKIYEYPGDDKGLGKQLIKAQKGNFSIRFQYNSNMKYLTIYKLGNNNYDTLKTLYHAVL